MIVYGASLSPFVRKTLAYLAEKGLQAELKGVNLGSGDPHFLEASPFGKMPGFRDDDFALSDSSAIIAYLEAKHPQPNLIPTEPRARGRTIWYEEFGDTIVGAAAGKVFFNRVVSPKFLGQPGVPAIADAAVQDEVPRLFDYLEKVVPASGFLVEDRLTLADIAVASPFINLAHCGVEPDEGTYPKTVAYLTGILSRPAFASMIEREKQILAR